MEEVTLAVLVKWRDLLKTSVLLLLLLLLLSPQRCSRSLRAGLSAQFLKERRPVDTSGESAGCTGVRGTASGS